MQPILPFDDKKLGAMNFQQAFQHSLLFSSAEGAISPAPSATDERQFAFTSRYRKSHATMSWTIDDFSVRDANEERLGVEFGVGDAASETRWRLQCFFGSCPEDHKEFFCLTLDLLSPEESRNAGLEISLVTPDGRKPCFKRLKSHQFRPNRDLVKSGIHSKVTRSYLIDNAAQLVPGDKLTIQCKLSVFGESTTACETKGAPGVATPAPELTTSILGRDLGRLLDDAAGPIPSYSSAASVSQTHADVTLSVDGSTFLAHKAILAARSEVFARMFDSKMIEQKCGEVEISDMDASVMKHFLRYVYTGEVGGALDVQLAKDLFTAADKYGISELKSHCENFMGRNLTVDNVSYIMVLAHLHGCKDLKRRTLDFFSSNPNRVMDSPLWDSVASAHPSLVRDALRAMAKRHGSVTPDPGESPKKKIKFYTPNSP